MKILLKTIQKTTMTSNYPQTFEFLHNATYIKNLKMKINRISETNQMLRSKVDII